MRRRIAVREALAGTKFFQAFNDVALVNRVAILTDIAKLTSERFMRRQALYSNVNYP